MDEELFTIRTFKYILFFLNKCMCLQVTRLWERFFTIRVVKQLLLSLWPLVCLMITLVWEGLFTDSALWAGSVIESPCPWRVCLSVCFCHHKTSTSGCPGDFWSKNVFLLRRRQQRQKKSPMAKKEEDFFNFFVSVLLYTSAKKVRVSRMPNFYTANILSQCWCLQDTGLQEIISKLWTIKFLFSSSSNLCFFMLPDFETDFSKFW